MHRARAGMCGGLAKVIVLSAATMLPFVGGCVAQGDWDKLYETNRTYKEQYEKMKSERDEALAALDALRGQTTRSETLISQLQTENGLLRQQLAGYGANLDELKNRLSGLQLSALDPETDKLLRELESMYPDLIKYDAARGVLRFASDLTFDSGSDAVKGEAKQSIARLAQILNSSAAAPYEVIVTGHTDAQRISANTAKRFPTNMHLSCGRAISVRSELVNQGVLAGKVQAAGWGEVRPLVPNSGNGNTPANRRVEIFLARPKAGENFNGVEGIAPATTTRPTRSTPVRDEIVK
jgi:flagellar motor protein MotB